MLRHEEKHEEKPAVKAPAPKAETPGEFKAFYDALTKTEASFKALSAAADRVKPPAPGEPDTSGVINEATASLLAARGAFDEALRRISSIPVETKEHPNKDQK